MAWHHGVTRARMAPSGGHCEVLAGHVAVVRGGRHGDGGYSRAQRAVSDSGNGRVRVEEAGKLTAPRRRAGQCRRRTCVLAVTPARKRDARPFHAQRSGVGLAVGRIVQRGQNMVEQVFDARSEPVEIALRRGGEVRAVLAGSIGVPRLVAEPCGEHACAPLDQMQCGEV